jgi:hypothetical protein
MNGAGDGGATDGKLGSFYGYKNTFNDNHTWVDVPKNGDCVLGTLFQQN